MKKTLLLTALAMAFYFGANAQNLVSNSDFETGSVTPWLGFKNDVVGVATTTPYGGDYCGRIQANDGSLYQIISVEAGASYEVTFYAKWAAATSQSFSFAVKEETGAKTKFFTKEIVANETGWTENKATFTATQETSVRLLWYKGQVDPSFPAFFMDNVSCVKQTATSIDNQQSIKAVVLPNPTNGIFNVTTDAKITNYGIYSTAGHLVKSEKVADLDKLSIDISAYSRGLYILKLETMNGEMVIKKILLK